MRSLNIHEILLWEDDFIMVNFTLMSGFFGSWLSPFPNAIHLSQVAALCVSLTSVSSRSGRKSHVDYFYYAYQRSFHDRAIKGRMIGP